MSIIFDLFFNCNLFPVSQPSEVTICHSDNLLKFVNFDETKHQPDTLGPKGGPQVQWYHNLLFFICGDHVKNDNHITDVYTTYTLELLPPLFIVDTKAKSKSNYNFDIEWCFGLHIVVGKYGTGYKMQYPCLYPYLQRDQLTRLLHPLFIKEVIL